MGSGDGFQRLVNRLHSNAMSQVDDEWLGLDTIELNGAFCPDPANLDRGGIIGVVDIVDIVRESASPWYYGPMGLVLARPRPVEFIPSAGALGFFNWQPMSATEVPVPAKWMLNWGVGTTPLQTELIDPPEMVSPLDRARLKGRGY
jgi:hypothetical protein